MRLLQSLCHLVLLANLTCAPESLRADDGVDPALVRERALLGAFPNIGERRNDVLVINYRSGRRQVFESDPHACEMGDADNCHMHFVWDYDPHREILVVQNIEWEWVDYDLIDLASESSITTATAPEPAPNARIWAVVDHGVGPVAGEGSGEILLISQKDRKFRIIGQRYLPMCKFERWGTNLAFFVICGSYSNDPLEGEFRVAPGPDGTLERMLTPRRVSDEEYRSILAP